MKNNNCELSNITLTLFQINKLKEIVALFCGFFIVHLNFFPAFQFLIMIKLTFLKIYIDVV